MPTQPPTFASTPSPSGHQAGARAGLSAAAPRLAAQEERDLAARVAQGDPEARDLLVRANLGLVVALAPAYAGRGLPLEDLAAEGNLGLLRAAEGFDGGAGVRFGTFAAHWIKQSMRRAVINQGRTVRLPAHGVTLLAKWRRAEAALAAGAGRRPTAEEVGAALGLTARRLATALELVRARGQSARREGDEEGGAWLDELASGEAGDGPLGRLSEADELAHALRGLGRLGRREAEVVRLRFGLDGEGPLTLRAIGGRLGLTRERVRQLEKKALAELAGA